jgi:gliding motility-associated transport system permease protein
MSNFSNVKVFSALYKKELKQYFLTPSAYVVMVVFLLISGYFFATPLFLVGQASISSFLEIAPLLMVFFVPAITMRLFSEEFKTHTAELLMTMPVSLWQILFSKLLLSLTLIGATLFLTLAYPLSITFLGQSDAGQILCAYLGLMAMGLLFSSVSLFASSLTKHQVTAFILGFLICFIFFVVGKLSAFMPSGILPITDFVGTQAHFDNLAKGIIDTRDVLYFLTFSGFFAFLTQARLWSMKTD